MAKGLILHIPSKRLGSFKQVMGKSTLLYTKKCQISGPKSQLELPPGEGGADQFRDALTIHTAHTDCRNGQKWLTASNGLHTPGNGTRSGARSQHCKMSIASCFMSAYVVIQCTHAILSQFLSFHFTFQPFPIPISPCSLPFYMYFTYTKYCICYTVYTYI